MRELDSLYSELQPQLARILAVNLNAPDWLIEDACQTAWSALFQNRDAVAPGGELGWLSTTATRAALRLLRREHGRAVYAQPSDPVDLDHHRPPAPGPDRSLELSERLAEIRRLPVRQQRVLMMHGFGYEYEEIAAATGATPRTVKRQLDRARQQLLRLAEEG